MKTVKFGGTSMSTADSLLRVKSLIESDSERRFVVVSAPGDDGTHPKVTDVLVSIAALAPSERTAAFAPVKERFRTLAAGVGLGGALDEELADIECDIDVAGRDYIVSRGEYLSAKLTAKLVGYEFVDAATLIKFRGRTYDDGYTENVCRIGLSGRRSAVVPGFYGSNEAGEAVTFSRGGSDVTGSIVARAIGASLYENFTDVDGFMTCDPRTVPHATIIDVLTYKELRELSYMGANVLHPESIFPVRKANIPIQILNTFNSGSKGTLIVPTEEFLNGKYHRCDCLPVTGIAGRKRFFSLHLEKSMMNAEVGFVRRVLSCFEKLGIAIEHIPSGIDSMTVVFNAVDRGTSNALIEAVRSEVKPDHISLTEDTALIAIVGHAMKSRPGAAARAVNCLSRSGINLRMIDQGASEINLILGVADGDFEKALIALNEEFSINSRENY